MAVAALSAQGYSMRYNPEAVRSGGRGRTRRMHFRMLAIILIIAVVIFIAAVQLLEWKGHRAFLNRFRSELLPQPSSTLHASLPTNLDPDAAAEVILTGELGAVQKSVTEDVRTFQLPAMPAKSIKPSELVQRGAPKVSTRDGAEAPPVRTAEAAQTAAQPQHSTPQTPTESQHSAPHTAVEANDDAAPATLVATDQRAQKVAQNEQDGATAEGGSVPPADLTQPASTDTQDTDSSPPPPPPPEITVPETKMWYPPLVPPLPEQLGLFAFDSSRAPRGPLFEPAHLPAVERIVVIGDLHGDLKVARMLFFAAGLINANARWMCDHLDPKTTENPPSKCSTHVVITGDFTDRQRYHTSALDERGERLLLLWLQRLHIQALRWGGGVHRVLGNHEWMNTNADYRYVSAQQADDFSQHYVPHSFSTLQRFVSGNRPPSPLNQRVRRSPASRMHSDGVTAWGAKIFYLCDLITGVHGPPREYAMTVESSTAANMPLADLATRRRVAYLSDVVRALYFEMRHGEGLFTLNDDTNPALGLNGQPAIHPLYRATMESLFPFYEGKFRAEAGRPDAPYDPNSPMEMCYARARPYLVQYFSKLDRAWALIPSQHTAPPANAGQGSAAGDNQVQQQHWTRQGVAGWMAQRLAFRSRLILTIGPFVFTHGCIDPEYLQSVQLFLSSLHDAMLEVEDQRGLKPSEPAVDQVDLLWRGMDLSPLNHFVQRWLAYGYAPQASLENVRFDATQELVTPSPDTPGPLSADLGDLELLRVSQKARAMHTAFDTAVSRVAPSPRGPSTENTPWRAAGSRGNLPWRFSALRRPLPKQLFTPLMEKSLALPVGPIWSRRYGLNTVNADQCSDVRSAMTTIFGSHLDSHFVPLQDAREQTLNGEEQGTAAKFVRHSYFGEPVVPANLRTASYILPQSAEAVPIPTAGGMVFGHTVQFNNRPYPDGINAQCSNSVFRIDVGQSRAFDSPEVVDATGVVDSTRASQVPVTAPTKPTPPPIGDPVLAQDLKAIEHLTGQRAACKHGKAGSAVSHPVLRKLAARLGVKLGEGCTDDEEATGAQLAPLFVPKESVHVAEDGAAQGDWLRGSADHMATPAVLRTQVPFYWRDGADNDDENSSTSWPGKDRGVPFLTYIAAGDQGLVRPPDLSSVFYQLTTARLQRAGQFFWNGWSSTTGGGAAVPRDQNDISHMIDRVDSLEITRLPQALELIRSDVSGRPNPQFIFDPDRPFEAVYEPRIITAAPTTALKVPENWISVPIEVFLEEVLFGGKDNTQPAFAVHA